jgi:hypothetical protein
MVGQLDRQTRALAVLCEAVERAAGYFSKVNPDLFDGYQTAHDVLAHLVFWQCEHVRVLDALLEGDSPDLRDESLAALNASACQEFSSTTMESMVMRLVNQHAELDTRLRRLPDWDIDYPIKEGGRPSTVADRVYALAAHINNHVAQLKRAAWAYRTEMPPRTRPTAD